MLDAHTPDGHRALYAAGMRCPLCTTDDTRVVDSRPTEEGRAIRRRRSCPRCGHRFTTFERASAVVVVKRDGRRQAFDASKVRLGVEITLADRPVPQDAVDDLVATVERAAYTSRGSIHADDIGAIVLEGLRDIDEVGYLRFASVYKEFQRASDFEREVASLDAEESLNERDR
ncbi:Ribonucleotide reductase transcriptional regulator NrdR [hydrothermal vent metagenome]|uniref:Ribonucleotide reductase transcriptional regulator NrdR n=1 Tax=hydrothermal vent metagenome TaxID=652676 RepID=A0A3B0RQN9_9ZZZZ